MDVRKARELLAEVEDALRAFAGWWPERAAWCSMYRLPELASLEHRPDLITVEPLSGRDARSLATQALLQIRYAAHQHPGTAIRFPGLVALTEAPGPLLERVQVAKEALFAGLQAAMTGKSAASRSKLYKELLPGVSILQATRHIGFLPYVPHTFAFTWLGQSISSQVLTPAAAIALVELQKDFPPPGTPPESWRAMLATQRDRIAALPATVKIQRRRRVAPHPRLLALPAKGEAPVTFGASLPVFFHLPSGKVSDLPTITPLRTFDRTATPAKRRPRTAARRHDLVPELELFYLTE